MICFTVPGQPVGKGRPRVTRSGHAYTPQKTRDAEAWIAQHAKQAMGPARPLEGPVSSQLAFIVPVPASWSKRRREQAARQEVYPAKPDIDNLAKAVLDACNGIVYQDDTQVVILQAAKLYGEPARTEVRISELRTVRETEADQPD